MNNILIIYDKNNNGKTGKKIFEDYHKKYKDCILNFNNSERIYFKNINLINNFLFHKKEKIIIKYFNIVIFNYGEDCSLSKDYLKKTIPIYNFIKNNYTHISIFNNPLNHNLITDKFITYKKLKNCKYVKIPDFGVTKKKNLVNIKKFPIIISRRKQSGGIGKYKINSKDELQKLDDNFIKNKFWATFYYSYLPNTNIFICIRLFIFNNKLVDFICRPSLDWNVHTGNQILNNKELIIKADKFFHDYQNNNNKYIQHILDELFNILGNGLYTHDFILVNNKLILCELGYKVLDPKLIKVHTDYDLLKDLSNKICNNPDKVHNVYKQLLLNYKK